MPIGRSMNPRDRDTWMEHQGKEFLMSKRHISLVIAGLIVAVFALSCIVFFTQRAGDNSQQAKIVDSDLQPVENSVTLEDSLVVEDVPIVP
jgi:hypothetical protein